MTQDQFLEAMSAAHERTPFGLVPCEGDTRKNLIRRRDLSPGSAIVEQCPITAVCDERTGRRMWTSEFEEAADHIGLSGDDAQAVALAADDAYGLPQDDDLRGRMLAIIEGDKEEEKAG